METKKPLNSLHISPEGRYNPTVREDAQKGSIANMSGKADSLYISSSKLDHNMLDRLSEGVDHLSNPQNINSISPPLHPATRSYLSTSNPKKENIAEQPPIPDGSDHSGEGSQSLYRFNVGAGAPWLSRSSFVSSQSESQMYQRRPYISASTMDHQSRLLQKFQSSSNAEKDLQSQKLLMNTSYPNKMFAQGSRLTDYLGVDKHEHSMCREAIGEGNMNSEKDKSSKFSSHLPQGVTFGTRMSGDQQNKFSSLNIKSQEDYRCFQKSVQHSQFSGHNFHSLGDDGRAWESQSMQSQSQPIFDHKAQPMDKGSRKKIYLSTQEYESILTELQAVDPRDFEQSEKFIMKLDDKINDMIFDHHGAMLIKAIADSSTYSPYLDNKYLIDYVLSSMRGKLDSMTRNKYSLKLLRTVDLL